MLQDSDTLLSTGKVFCQGEGQSTALHAVLGESLTPEPITQESDTQNSQKNFCEKDLLIQCPLSDQNKSAAPCDKAAHALEGKTVSEYIHVHYII